MTKDLQRNMLYIVLVLMVLVLIVVTWHERYYLPMSFLMLLLSIIPFYIRFERQKAMSEEIVIIAVLGAIAAVSRVPFASLPSVQPTSFVIIISGLVFGPQVGFMVGSTAALVSNFFLGQGPWTPWQMFAWGVMGLIAGLLRNNQWINNRIGISVFGFVGGFVFGWFMNLWFVIGFFDPITWEVFLTAYTASFYFDLAHAVSNVFFILIFYKSWHKILNRAKMKFGVFKSWR